MPAPSDIIQFMRGQLFERPTLPKTSLIDKCIVITGANTGLGFECAKQVTQLGASTIVLGCRSLEKGKNAKKEIQSILGHKSCTIHVWQIDLTSCASVKAFAARLRTLPRLDALIANAGISTNQYAIAENLESTLTVNVVSTFLLACLALPQLRTTAVETGAPTHLTIVGSNVHAFADDTQLQAPAPGKVFATLTNKQEADMAARYFLSKLIVMQCVRALAAAAPLAGEASVIINCPSPGWCKTELFRTDDGGFMGRNMLKLIGRTADVGGRCLTSAITAGTESHGQYLSECRVKQPSVFVRSSQGQTLEKRLWSELEATLTEIAPEATQSL